MIYEVKKAEFQFDKSKKLTSVTVTAAMPGNPKDVRKLKLTLTDE